MTISGGPVGRFDLSVRENVDRGGAVAAAVRDPDALAGSRSRHVIILVHGFNNTATFAADSFKALGDPLAIRLLASRVAPDAIATFQWPGDVAVGPWQELDAIGYPIDIENAQAAAARLAQFLTSLHGGAMPPEITLVGHSMGCRLVLEMLRLAGAALGRRLRVVALMAGAVPVEMLVGGGTLSAVCQTAVTTLSLFSEDDDVLRYAYPLGQAAATALRIDPPTAEAAGLHGHPLSFAQAVRTSGGHGHYWADTLTVDTLMAALDPTQRHLPPDHVLPSRALPGRGLPGRALPDRSLPEPVNVGRGGR